MWLFLLLYQLSLIGKNNYSEHRKIGVAVLFIGPLLFATTALLSVHSAHKGLVSGEGDFLIVQNVGVTIEVGIFIALAFIFKKHRKLHASFLLSTLLLFMGIALFFTFLSFLPQYKIEGPETFYRFGAAAQTASYVTIVVGLIFFVKAYKSGWPLFIAGLLLTINQSINLVLIENKLIQPLTETVGSFNKVAAFLVSFFLLLIILYSTGIRKGSALKSA
jgi:hypothetical protein